MNTTFRLVVMLCLYVCLFGKLFAQQKDALTVFLVKDAQSKKPLQTKFYVGSSEFYTDANGKGIVSSKAQGSEILHIDLDAYYPYFISIKELKEKQPYSVFLEPLTSDLDELIIETEAVKRNKNIVSEQLALSDIIESTGATFGATLAKIKGISTIESGATISKPVIHGMTGNRILILNNGVRQTGQQWGTDHAPELDMHAANNITVVKGADAVRYGSEALGGVVILEGKKLPYFKEQTKGSFTSLYGSNGKRMVFTGYAEGTLPFLKAMAWRVQGTYSNAGDRHAANYLLNNTGMREQNFSAALGYRSDAFESELYYSRFYTKLGVLNSAQMGDVDLLKIRIALGRPLFPTAFSREIDVPHQQVLHQLFRWNNSYYFNDFGKIKLTLAYQKNKREEFHSRRNNRSHIPSLSLILASYQANLSWTNTYSTFWESEIGTQLTGINNFNTPGTGVVPLIPNYIEKSAGVYGLQKYNQRNWSLEAGLRYENMYSNAAGIDAFSEAYGGIRKFNNLSFNIGGKVNGGSRWQLVSNLGLAFRGAHVHELYSNGLEHANGIYVIGQAGLKSERGLKWIAALKYAHKNINFSVEGYAQWVKNFIYQSPTKEFMPVVSGTYPVFRYLQTDAFFRGINSDFQWQLNNNWSYTFMQSMVWANEKPNGGYLPFIPSFRWQQSVEYKLSFLKEAALKLGHKYVARQTRFDSNIDLISEAPEGYHLFELTFKAALLNYKGNKLQGFLQIDNLLNKEYKEYTNRFRYFAHELGTDIRVSVTWSF